MLSSADSVIENAPTLKSTVTLPGLGTFDVWANFWGYPNADWRIMAGLSTNGIQVFRQRGSRQVEAGNYDTAIILSNTPGYFLYQAYVGRVTSATVDVFVDDYDIQIGTVSTQVGDTARTWYDGVSYAKVGTFRITSMEYDGGGPSGTLTWSSVPAELSLSTTTYPVQRKNSLTETNWTTLATGIHSAGATTSYVDDSATAGAAFYRVTSP